MLRHYRPHLSLDLLQVAQSLAKLEFTLADVYAHAERSVPQPSV
jgi:hypothetical protein